MGNPAVPDYANSFMAEEMDKNIKMKASNYDKEETKALELMKRFLDDIFLVFCGSTKDLHNFLTEVNSINPSIQLTMTHTAIKGEAIEDKCDCEPVNSISFLDTECSIKEGKIETTLFRKPTDRNQYLLPTSCHPKQTTKSIPFSLATRIIRICSSSETRDKELENLKTLLFERQYKAEIVNCAIEKAKTIPRAQLLKPKLTKKTNERPVFAVMYDPRMPSLQPIQAKHWRSMVSRDAHLQKVFPQPPLTAFKRQRNLKDLLIRAKIPPTPKRNQERSTKGMKMCLKVYCNTCPYVKERKNFKYGKDKIWNVNKKTNCNSMNIVYVIECDINTTANKDILARPKEPFGLDLRIIGAMSKTNRWTKPPAHILTCPAMIWPI